MIQPFVSHGMQTSSFPNSAEASVVHSRSIGERLMILLLRGFVRSYLFCTPSLGGRVRLHPSKRLTILLTGTFHSAAWATAHLVPLTQSIRCDRVIVVSTFPLAGGPRLTIVRPPGWLVALAGSVAARLLVFAWLAVRLRPDIVGGFHLLFNGLVAGLVGRLVGAVTAYFCVGGAAEVQGGGIRSENRLFGRLTAPEPELERLLIDTTKRFDLIVTMGSGAASFLRNKSVPALVSVNPGAIDGRQFAPGSASQKDIDVLFVGRLVPIKRIDRFLEMVRELSGPFPHLRAVLVGEGSLRGDLEQFANALAIGSHVTFAGRSAEVAQFLRRAKVFVLTSESEGVALSMLEAMAAGVPVVVSNVGDLADVIDGVDRGGYLVDDQRPETIAARVADLLRDETKHAAAARAARERASNYSVEASSALWNSAFTTLSRSDA